MRSWKFEIKDTFDNRMIAGIVSFVLMIALSGFILMACDSDINSITDQDIEHAKQVVCKDHGGVASIEHEWRREGIKIQCKNYFRVSNYTYEGRK